MITIYYFCNSGGCSGEGNWHSATAIASDGKWAASHICSKHSFMLGDLVHSKKRFAELNSQYGEGGWCAEFVENSIVAKHAGLLEAYRLNQVFGKERGKDG